MLLLSCGVVLVSLLWSILQHPSPASLPSASPATLPSPCHLHFPHPCQPCYRFGTLIIVSLFFSLSVLSYALSFFSHFHFPQPYHPRNVYFAAVPLWIPLSFSLSFHRLVSCVLPHLISSLVLLFLDVRFLCHQFHTMFPFPYVPFISALSTATLITSNTFFLSLSPLSCLSQSFCCHSHIHFSPYPLEPSITISRDRASGVLVDKKGQQIDEGR